MNYSETKSESRIQQELVQWYRNNFCLAHHSPRCLILSIPNENNPRKAQTGAYAGASDLLIIHVVNKNSIRVIFAEIKTEEGMLSDAQEGFQEHITSMAEFLNKFEIDGIKIHTLEYHVVRSLEEFKSIIINQKIHDKFSRPTKALY